MSATFLKVTCRRVGGSQRASVAGIRCSLPRRSGHGVPCPYFAQGLCAYEDNANR
jgi:hypothetical protein